MNMMTDFVRKNYEGKEGLHTSMKRLFYVMIFSTFDIEGDWIPQLCLNQFSGFVRSSTGEREFALMSGQTIS